MASKEKKNGGDFVLESKHLVGLFMLLVVIFAVVFTLGYLLGRSQYDTRLRAAIGKTAEDDRPVPAVKIKPKPVQEVEKPKQEVSKPTQAEAAEPAPPPTHSDWDFYHSAEPKKTEDHLQPVKKNVSVEQPSTPRTIPVSAKLAKMVRPAPAADAPLIPKGTVMLQVAAVTSQEDALALAQALQQKKFPAFVLTPKADKFFRIQVGPFPDNKSATAAKQDLEAKGFKSIVKR